MFRARRNPRGEAVLDWDTGIRYTWGDLRERAERLAGFLVHRIGLAKGDRVGFLCPVDIAMIDMCSASFTTGIVVTTYNYRLKEAELVDMIDNESPKVMFFTKANEEKAARLRMRASTPFVPICIDGYAAEASWSMADIMAASDIPGASQADVRPEDPAMLIHTGGTTGRPKAAVLSFQSLFLNSVSELVTMRLTESDRAYVCMPFYHTGGWNVFTLPLLLAGGSVILSREFSPDTFFDVVERERPTMFLAADMMYKAIVNHPRFSEADLSCFKWVAGGASAISETSMQPFWDKGVRFFIGYGMTETGPNNFFPDVGMTLAQNKAKSQTVGKPMAFTQARIVDADGRDVPAGVRGEVLMRGGLSFSGYWRNEEETRAIVREGWIHTGDMGYRDDDGDFYVCGRLKNMFISGGENVFPSEIEQCLEAFPPVREACVIGVPDERWGEVGKALLVLEPGAEFERDELCAFLAANLSTIKRPRHYEIVGEIPKNEAGKRDEQLIRAKYGCDRVAC
ncbi:class I adenylate-forming enzyme family protein [Arabiibacter massiliensis]|uniref:class I adenylate-forming enzyme family protein n=1 Tax=Arabiibacter massiliensis TaxID=1870985 RepID=UPI001E3B0C63|nr:AMP-binding protein [Arabiibacter massiliensis]